MFDLKEYKIYNELITLKYLLSEEKSLKNYTKIIDEIIKLCNSQKEKIKEMKEKELMNRKMNEIAETQILSYGQGYRDGINKETTACAIVARERENQIIYEAMKHKINNEWLIKIRLKIEEVNKICKECRFKGEICKELCKNNQCTQGTLKQVLQELLKVGEENV